MNKTYNLNECLKCGGSEFLSNDNSITKIKDKFGSSQTYPVRKCKQCGAYHGVDSDINGVYVELLDRGFINELNCKNWF